MMDEVLWVFYEEVGGTLLTKWRALLRSATICYWHLLFNIFFGYFRPFVEPAKTSRGCRWLLDIIVIPLLPL